MLAGKMMLLPRLRSPSHHDWRCSRVACSFEDDQKCISVFSFPALFALHLLFADTVAVFTYIKNHPIIPPSPTGRLRHDFDNRYPNQTAQ